MKPFLITSVGRTATKWLAWAMNKSDRWIVEHEPKAYPIHPCRGAVSPKHLYQMVKGLALPDKSLLDVGVIIRDPIAQAISIQNRAKVLKAPCEELYNLHAPEYFRILNLLLERGAKLIKFGDMTTDKDYLKGVMQAFGVSDVEINEAIMMERKNVATSYPVTVLSGKMKRMTKEFAVPFWEKWRGE